MRSGFSREEVRSYYGEPLRIEPASAGGENWFYRFWVVDGPRWEEPTPQELAENDGITIKYSFTEAAIHFPNEGLVTRPIPRGKIQKNLAKTDASKTNSSLGK